MAHKRDYKPEDIAFPEQHIVSSELVSEMEKSYIEYAMSVIVGRALPDVRDGLKPVHRRILYAMYEDGLTRDKPYRKCATAVGDVLGRYHPHGDASVYDALVRMAQSFSLRYPLIDGHGNFGDVDGNPPAAYRYTEARLARMADEMLRDIDKNIPPHNLREVIGAAVEVLDNPDATLDDLMRHVKGPDFPTKGIIMGRAGIRAAYATGRGKITIRARTEFEEHGQNRVRIIVTELPYQVNKKMLIKSIAEQVKDKRLDDISDLRDESDRNGMRIVIELKRDANPQVALNRLFAQTTLQSTFSIINLALVENQRQPKILSLRHILDEYLAFQEEVITRRTQYDLRKARERAHLLEGLLIAQDNIDEVIRIIRSSYDNAKDNLMQRFGLDDVQAQAILDMRLKALQGLDREKLQTEYDELEKKIAYYLSLLEDPEKLKGVLKDELLAIAEKYGDERQTEIQDVADEIDVEDLIAEEQCVFTLSHNGYIKRTPAAEYRAQSRGGKGVRGMATREEDYVESVFTASTHDFLLFFSSRGQVYVRKGYQIPEAGRSARGTNIVNILPLEPEEKISAMLRGKGLREDHFIVFFTKNGVTKRMSQGELRNVRKNGIRALDIREGDELVQVLTTNGSEKLLVVTRQGMAVRYDENDVRPMGRTAAGVRAIKLREGDEVVAAVRASDENAAVLTVTENGYGKRTLLGEYGLRNRGCMGLMTYRITDKTGEIVGAKKINGDEDVLLVSDDGTIIRMEAGSISLLGRATQGVRLMRPAPGARVVAMARAEREPDEEEPAEAGESAETKEADAEEE